MINLKFMIQRYIIFKQFKSQLSKHKNTSDLRDSIIKLVVSNYKMIQGKLQHFKGRELKKSIFSTRMTVYEAKLTDTSATNYFVIQHDRSR